MFFSATFFIIIPAVLIRKILIWNKKCKESYFEDVAVTKNTQEIFGISYQSRLTRFFYVLMWLCIFLGKYLNHETCEQNKKKFAGSPNEVTGIVSSMLRSSLVSIKNLTDEMNAKYLFCLQPTLMDGQHPLTKDDKIFVESRRKQIIMGFPYVDYYEKYYQVVRNELTKDEKLKDNFIDTSKIFYNANAQRFVDTCHIGDIGQREIGEEIARAIMDQESRIKTTPQA